MITTDTHTHTHTHLRVLLLKVCKLRGKLADLLLELGGAHILELAAPQPPKQVRKGLGQPTLCMPTAKT